MWDSLRGHTEAVGLAHLKVIFHKRNNAMSPKGTLRQVFYLSETPQYTYSHREGEQEELTREKVRGAIVHKAGRKYQHD
jgi:hypothetical protein